MDNVAQAEDTQDKWAESYTIRVTGLNDFYSLVRGLNRQLGHGNWTIKGRVLKRVKRIDKSNKFAAHFPSMVNVDLKTGELISVPGRIHTIELTVLAPAGSESAVSTAMFNL